jgi:hypothetical protein
MKYKIATLAVVLCLALLLNGCAPACSIFALYKADDKAFEKDLIGTWKLVVTNPDDSDSNKNSRWIFQQSTENSYDFKWGVVGTKGGFLAKVRLVRIGTLLFIDVEGNTDDEAIDARENPVSFPTIPVHMFGRIWLEKNKLEIHFLNDDWVKAQAKAGTLPLSYLDADGNPLLTAKTDDLRKFMQDHADDEAALSENYSLVREK